MEVGADDPSGSERSVGLAADAVAAVGLVVVAFLLRRNAFSRDGLWYDDAWVAIGAIKGSISDIPVTGGAHPGFTLLLWLQHHTIGGAPERLAALAMVLGVLGPALLYMCLRSLGYEKASSFVAGAALAVTPAHIIYSGRVKSYTIDVVLVALLVAALPRIAQRRWGWAAVAGWLGIAITLGSISGYVMVATAIAAGILVLHPEGDRVQRVVALVVQGVVQGGWVLYTRRFADLDEIEHFMESAYDAHVERSANPLEMAGNLLRHFERVVDVHPGAPGPLLLLLALVVLAGLVVGALGRLDRARAIVSRFALASLAFAALAATVDRFPFGPSTDDLSTVLGAPGARHSLWLVPMTAIGICNAIDLATRTFADRAPAANALRLAVVGWAVVLVWSRWAPHEEPRSGRRSHVAMVEQAAADGAFIVLDVHISYQFLIFDDGPVHLAPTPEEMVGFIPEPDPEEGTVLRPAFLPDVMADFIERTDRDRLVVYGVDVPHADVFTDAGWTRESTDMKGGLRVTVWSRSDA